GLVRIYIFFLTDLLEMVNGIIESDPFEIKYLATTQDRGKDLMLFRCCQDENSIGRRFLERFQKCIKSGGAKHVNFVDNVNFLLPRLRCKTDLVDKGSDVIDRIVAGGIQFMNVQRSAFVKRDAGITNVTRLTVRRPIFAVDGLCQYSCASCLPH